MKLFVSFQFIFSCITFILAEEDFLDDQPISFFDPESILDTYQVTIYRNKKPVCDGCLINNLHVLTVASCFVSKERDDYKFKIVDSNEVTVVGGTSNLPSGKFQVQAILLYLLRDYLESPSDSSVDDIAVLKLNKVLNVFLPEYPNKWLRLPGYDRHQDLFDSIFLSISGSRQQDRILNNEIETTYKRIYFARVELLSRSSCTNYFQGEVESTFFQTTNNIMCAKVVQRDPELFDGMCTGNFGSPMIYKNADDRAVLIGLLSRKPYDCRETTIPGIYVNISSYLNFIINSVEGNYDNNQTQSFELTGLSSEPLRFSLPLST